MINKSFSLMSLGILVLLILTSFASAITLTPPTAALAQADGNFTLTIASSAGAGSLTYTVKDSAGVAQTGFTFNQSAFTGNESLTVLYTVPAGFAWKFEETYKITATATETAVPANNASADLTFSENTKFYDGANEGELSVSGIEFNVLEGLGDDEDYWYPFDDVEVSFNVENAGDWDVKSIKLAVCVWDETKGKCVFDEDDMDIDTGSFSLDSGDDKDVSMTFNVDADKLTGGNTDYTIYIKAVGKIDDSNSAYDEDQTGDYDSKGIKIVTSDTFAVLGNIQISESASCGSNVQITADVWNLDEEKQKDIYLVIYNKELGINQKVILGDISAFDKEQLDVTITLPEDAEEKQYDLSLKIYNEDGDIFQTDEEEDLADFLVPLKVTAGSCSGISKVSVTASLESDAKAGQEFIVKAIIQNIGSKKSTLNLELSDIDWASVVDIDKKSFELEAGKSQEVLIKLKANNDVSGEKKFTILIKEGAKVLSQSVSVPIEKQFEFPGFSAITGLFAGGQGNNMYVWIIGALDLVIVLVIIFVALKVIKKK